VRAVGISESHYQVEVAKLFKTYGDGAVRSDCVFEPKEPSADLALVR
jgi:hypothetical protein